MLQFTYNNLFLLINTKKNTKNKSLFIFKHLNIIQKRTLI